VLEGAQAGLSWLTVLKRREGYRQAFADFDPAAVAAFDRRRREALLLDPGIVRHRQKVDSAISNAVALLRVGLEFGSFDHYVWSFVDGRPRVSGWSLPEQVPFTSPTAKALSADLRRRGFRFVGPTICYSYMQAAGLVNDHLQECFRTQEAT
jgi:DNA-3-methyladenine glycosylase I